MGTTVLVTTVYGVEFFSFPVLHLELEIKGKFPDRTQELKKNTARCLICFAFHPKQTKKSLIVQYL